MKRVLEIAIVILLQAAASTAQIRTGDTARDSSSAFPESVKGDSALSSDEVLPPLSLEPLYHAGDSLPPFSIWPDIVDPYGSWMSERVGEYPDGPPLEFIFAPSPYAVTGEQSNFKRPARLLDSRSNLISPWKLEMESQAKYKILRTILGSVQVGGVAYLMYMHFKKYGLR